MRFSIRPGKVTCAGLVGILIVLPNSIWKDPNAKDQEVIKPPARAVLRAARMDDSDRPRLKLRKVPR
jgi:hypothetical protein